MSSAASHSAASSPCAMSSPSCARNASDSMHTRAAHDARRREGREQPRRRERVDATDVPSKRGARDQHRGCQSTEPGGPPPRGSGARADAERRELAALGELRDQGTVDEDPERDPRRDAREFAEVRLHHRVDGHRDGWVVLPYPDGRLHEGHRAAQERDPRDCEQSHGWDEPARGAEVREREGAASDGGSGYEQRGFPLRRLVAVRDVVAVVREERLGLDARAARGQGFVDGLYVRDDVIDGGIHVLELDLLGARFRDRARDAHRAGSRSRFPFELVGPAGWSVGSDARALDDTVGPDGARPCPASHRTRGSSRRGREAQRHDAGSRHR